MDKPTPPSDPLFRNNMSPVYIPPASTEKVIPSSLLEMAGSWRFHDSFATEDGRFRLSLQSPIEEPQSYFLDLRRWFLKDGHFLCTKRGIRVSTSPAHIAELVKTLQTIVEGKERRGESAGLCLIRRTDMLHIRKKVLADGVIPVYVVLSPTEAVFLLRKLIVLQDIIIARVEDEDSDEEMEQWF